MFKSFSQLALAGVLLVPAISAAQDWEISGQIGVSPTYFVFEETVDGNTLNEETGTLPALNLQAFVATPTGVGFGLYYSRADGSLDYEGRSQLGIPVNTDSEMDWSDLSLVLAYQWRGNWLATGWGRDNWERDIAAPSLPVGEDPEFAIAGLSEERTIDYVFFGITRNLYANAGYTLGAKLQLDYGYNVDFEAAVPGYAGPAIADGGSAVGARLSFPMNWNLLGRFSIGAAPYLQYWQVEEQNSDQLLQPIAGDAEAARFTRPEASLFTGGINFSVSFSH